MLGHSIWGAPVRQGHEGTDPVFRDGIDPFATKATFQRCALDPTGVRPSRLRFSMRVKAEAGTLRDRVGDLMPELRGNLEALVRIPSISHPGHDASQLRRSAEAAGGLLRDAGCQTK